MIPFSKEQQFISLLNSDDKNAFRFLLDNYGGVINGIVRNFFPESAMADLVFKKIFLQIYKDIHDYDKSKMFLFTWLMLQTRKCLSEANYEEFQTPEKSITNRNIIDLSYGYTKENISKILAIPINILHTVLRGAISKIRTPKTEC